MSSLFFLSLSPSFIFFSFSVFFYVSFRPFFVLFSCLSFSSSLLLILLHLLLFFHHYLLFLLIFLCLTPSLSSRLPPHVYFYFPSSHCYFNIYRSPSFNIFLLLSSLAPMPVTTPPRPPTRTTQPTSRNPEFDLSKWL